jgi:hypothetical protein
MRLYEKRLDREEIANIDATAAGSGALWNFVSRWGPTGKRTLPFGPKETADIGTTDTAEPKH